MPNFNFSITGKGQLQVWFWPKKDKSQILLPVNNQNSLKISFLEIICRITSKNPVSRGG